MSRIIPIIMDQGALSEAARAEAHAHTHTPADELRKGVPGRAPVFLKVGDTEISEADIAREMQHHRTGSPHESRAEAARALVVRELLRLEVERLGLADAAEPEGDETLEEASIRVLIEREAPTPQPDRDSCLHYYEANRSRLREPDQIQVRHILLAAAPADAEGRAKACAQGESLISELKLHPERFTEFAQRHSDCPSKDQGGELGWIGRGDTTPEFERQLFMLKPGLAGLTVESRWGHHVVMVDAIERGAMLNFEQAEPKIAAYLETQVRQNAIHQYLQILRERHGVRGLDEIAPLS
jgi:peptidyl-prolyl cis-trans isomerase C